VESVAVDSEPDNDLSPENEPPAASRRHRAKSSMPTDDGDVRRPAIDEHANLDHFKRWLNGLNK
jgi:hypothetical protein